MAWWEQGVQGQARGAKASQRTAAGAPPQGGEAGRGGGGGPDPSPAPGRCPGWGASCEHASSPG